MSQREIKFEVGGKKYNLTALKLRQAIALETKAMAMFFSLQNGTMTNEDALFEMGEKLLAFGLCDGNEIKDIEDHFEYECGVEDFNIVVFEALRGNFPKLLSKIDLSQLTTKMAEALSE